MILDDIVADKRRELAQSQAKLPLTELERCISKMVPPLDFAGALRGDGIRLIAEVKKASPSKGLLCPQLDAVGLAKIYADNGAAAISVLTEVNYFQGSLEHLSAIKEALGSKQVPLLRKDFIFHPYQVYESRAFGADAILLITAILTDDDLQALLSLSQELGIKCLVEVHNRMELERAVQSGAEIIGINNRNLHTFAVDIATTFQLCPLVPRDRVIVSESGISNHGDIQKLHQLGVNAVLIGEALVTATNVTAKMKELL